MNQSEFEANARGRRQARENTCGQVSHDWFWFSFSLVEKVARVLTNHRAQENKIKAIAKLTV